MESELDKKARGARAALHEKCQQNVSVTDLGQRHILVRGLNRIESMGRRQGYGGVANWQLGLTRIGSTIVAVETLEVNSVVIVMTSDKHHTSN